MKKIILGFILSSASAFTINAQTDYDTLTTTTCSDYTWRGNTYTASGIYYDTVVVANFDTTYTFTNSNQSFTVPNSLTSISIALSGAGGGVGYDDYNYADGGSGAYVTGIVSTTPGNVITVIVGEGGASGIGQTNNDTYGDGTAGTYINNGNYGGAGGGRTALQLSGNDIVSAGGGGGGGYTSGLGMTSGGAGGTGTGPNGGGNGGGYPSGPNYGDGAGGFSYITDPLFTLNTSTNGGANNAGTGSTVDVIGGNGQAIISWVKDSVYVLDLTISPLNATVSSDGNTLTSDLVGDTYQWIDCGTNTAVSGATSATFIPTANGDYAVIVTSGTCDDTSACVNYNSVGLNENNNSVFTAYPNPTTGLITINSNNAIIAKVVVRDAAGRVIFENSNTSTSSSIDLTEMENGIYFITVFDANQSQTTMKVIKK